MIDLTDYQHLTAATACDFFEDTINVSSKLRRVTPALAADMRALAEAQQLKVCFKHARGSFTVAPDGYYIRKEAKRIAADPSLDADGRYIYGTVEPFHAIAVHASGCRRYVVRGMRFHKMPDLQFTIACLDYFRSDSPHRKTAEALAKCVELLPDEGQWRQGRSSHQLAIWPAKPNPDLRYGDAYWGEDAIQVGDFKHGSFTWFCIMAHAYVAHAKENA